MDLSGQTGSQPCPSSEIPMMSRRTTTPRCRALFAALAALASIHANPLRAAEAPPKPAELKVLEKLIGDWTSETVISVLDAQPQDLKTTGTLTRKWELDGRVVEESGKSSNGEEFKVIFTYDAARHAYRFVYFSSAGFVDSSGPWDEAAQTFA